MQVANTNNKCFIVWSNEIEGRIDAYYYSSKFDKVKKLQNKKTIKFGDLIEVITKGETPLWRGDVYSASGIPFLKVQNISEGGIKGDLFYISDKIHDRMKRSQLNGGELLYTMAGRIGTATILPDNFGKANINQAIAKIILKKDTNRDYIKCLLNSDFCKLQVERFLTTSAQPNINFEQIKDIKIPLLSPETQNKIVEIMQSAYDKKASKEQEAENILNSIDDYILGELEVKISKIENKKCFLVNYEEIKNQRIDPFFYQPKYQAITKSLNKSKYSIKKLEDLCLVEWGNTNLTKKIYKEKGYPAFSASGQDGYLDFYEHDENAVILSAIGARCGKCFLARGKWTAIKNTIIIKPIEQTKINIVYLYIFLNNENLWEKSGGAQPFITMKSANNLKIPLPPIEIQEKLASEFENRLEKANKLKTEAKSEIEKAKQEVEKIILGQ